MANITQCMNLIKILKYSEKIRRSGEGGQAHLFPCLYYDFFGEIGRNGHNLEQKWPEILPVMTKNYQCTLVPNLKENVIIGLLNST